MAESWVRCADGGRCHHQCRPGPCFRVMSAGPLSNVFPGDTWPEPVVQAERVLAGSPEQAKPSILGLPITADQGDPIYTCSPISAFAVIKAMDGEGNVGYMTAITQGLNLVEALGMNQFAGMRMVSIIGGQFGGS